MVNDNEQLDKDLSLKLFVVLSRAAQTIRKRVEENIRGFRLNPTEFAVLELLYSKGEQPIQKIGEKVLIASSSITYVVDKLEGKGYLKRKPCVEDRRITYAVITDEGKKIMDDIFPPHRDFIHDICSGLNKEEKTYMIEQLKKLGLYAERLKDQ